MAAGEVVFFHEDIVKAKQHLRVMLPPRAASHVTTAPGEMAEARRGSQCARTTPGGARGSGEAKKHMATKHIAESDIPPQVALAMSRLGQLLIYREKP